MSLEKSADKNPHLFLTARFTFKVIFIFIVRFLPAFAHISMQLKISGSQTVKFHQLYDRLWLDN